MSDVTAVVLTLGEPTTDEALGLCRGLLAPETDAGQIDADFGLLRNFLASPPDPAGDGNFRRLAGRLRRWLRP